MATWIGIGLGLAYAAAGWAVYVFAPRIGPNPIFGVRTWYSMVNRDVWNQSNRAGGILFAALGALVFVSSLLSRLWVDADSKAGVLTVVGILLALTAVGVLWLVLYTRRLAAGALVQSADVIRVSPVWLLPAALLTLAILVFLLATSSDLPADRVAVHFNGHGEPDGWMSRAGHTWLGSAAVLGVFALLSALFLVLTHVPMPNAATWPIAGEPVMHFLAVALFLVEAILGVAFLDVYWFNTRAEHLWDVGALVLVSVGAPLAAVSLGIPYIVLYGRALKRRRS